MKQILWGALLLTLTGTHAAQNYCNANFQPNPQLEYQLDLTKLNKPLKIAVDEQTTPLPKTTEVILNPCDPLVRPEDVPEVEFCHAGSYVCRRIIYTSNDKKIVAEVQDIAGDIGDEKLNAVFSLQNDAKDLTKDGTKYTLTLNGGKVKDQPQSAEITFECDTSQSREAEPEAPTIVGYENNKLSLYWKTVHVCASSPANDPSGGKGGGMSGFGIFFTIVGVLLAVYFVGGAFYNYKTYNAQGLDLIPHRDFWLDLPYLVKDLVSHVMDSVMSHRRGSGGYVSV